MKIDADVQKAARHFGLDPALIQAVVIAEGDIIKAVQCSLPNTTTRDEALDVLCRSAAHALNDYAKRENAVGFVDFWSERWAPRGVANDPKNLNANWAKNVKALWLAPKAIGMVRHDATGPISTGVLGDY